MQKAKLIMLRNMLRNKKIQKIFFSTLFLIIFCMINLKTNAAGIYFDEAEIISYSIPNSIVGDTFYVDTINGSDSYNGLSPSFTSGTSGPFKTLTKCFDRYRSNNVMGGDVVKIKAGIYRESLVLAFTASQISSLAESSPLTIGPYGDGEVIIDPSPTPQTWTAYDSNIYWADWSNATYPPQAVIMENNFKAYRDKQALEDLTQKGFWYFDPVARRIYVHTDGIDPMTLDPVVTYNYSSAENYAVNTSGYSYIHLYGLTMRGAAKYGYTDYPGGVGAKLENCTVKWNNGNGLRIFGTYGVLRKNHIWGNMLYAWPRGRRYAANGGWGQGATIGGYGLAEGNIVHDNGGEGMGVYGGTGHVIFQDNIVYDNWSVGLYLDNASYCTFQRNFIYSHDPDVSDIVEQWQLPTWIIDAGASTITVETNKIVARLRQEGIMAGDESATNPVAQSIGFKAVNNIIIGARRGFTTYGQATGSGLNNYTIAGNTIIMPKVAPSYGAYAGIAIYSSINNANSVIKNNIVYSNAPNGSTQPLVNFASNAAISGVDFNNNLYYSVNSATPFKSGSYPNEVEYGFDNWRKYVPSGFETNSIYANPLFIGIPGSFKMADYQISPESLAINSGAFVASENTDFFGITRPVGSAMDIGAFEYSEDLRINFSISNFISLIMDWLKNDSSSEDFNSDGIVNTKDLGIMMSRW